MHFLWIYLNRYWDVCLESFITVVFSTYNLHSIVVSFADPMGNVYLRCCSQEGRSSELRLRRGVGQAAHTLSQ